MSDEIKRGEEICEEIDEQVEVIKADVLKFFDRGMNKPATRARVAISAFGKYGKALRAEIAEVKNARKAAKAEA